jgi:Glyoxalase/Bleomycin resistance protein/Dioxygenase superfamily
VVSGFHHLTLNVADLSRARDFYEGILRVRACGTGRDRARVRDRPSNALCRRDRPSSRPAARQALSGAAVARNLP